MGGQYTQWIILALVIGASVVSWIFRKVQEEAERRRVRDEMARREMERLRTGREPGESETATQMQRAQELAARRQAQLQELRRRQQERSRQQQQVRTEPVQLGPAGTRQPTLSPPTGLPRSQPGRQPPIVWVPGSSGPTVPQRGPTPLRRPPQQQPTLRPQPTARPRPQPAARPAPQQQQPLRASRPSLFQPPPEAPPPPPRPAGPPPLTPAREAYVQQGPAPSLLSSIKPRSRDEWRRAIILHEVLSPPIGQRAAHLPD